MQDNHLAPPTQEKVTNAYEMAKSADPTLWGRLDAIVFHAILKRNENYCL